MTMPILMEATNARSFVATLLGAVSVCGALFAGECMGATGQYPIRDSSDRTRNQVARFEYQVGIEIDTYRGAKGQIRSNHACREKTVEKSDSSRYLNSAYREFPTKEVVVFFYPNPCVDVSRLAKFLPTVVHLDRGKNPIEMTFIIHERYYSGLVQPRVRTSNIELTVSKSPGSDFDRHLFDGILSTTDGGELTKSDDGKDISRDLDSIFAGVNAYAFSPEIWSRFPMLAEHLQREVKSKVVDVNLIHKFAGKLIGRCGYGYFGAGEHIPCGGNFDGRSITFPLILNDGVWRIPPIPEFGSERYVFYDRYIASVQGCTWAAGSCRFNQHEFRIEIDGVVLPTPKVQSQYFFNASTKVLYFVMARIFATKTGKEK